MPINTEDDSLFHVFGNGIAACKLMLQIDSNCIDERAINKGANINIYQIKENL